MNLYLSVSQHSLIHNASEELHLIKTRPQELYRTFSKGWAVCTTKCVSLQMCAINLEDSFMYQTRKIVECGDFHERHKLSWGTCCVRPESRGRCPETDGSIQMQTEIMHMEQKLASMCIRLELLALCGVRDTRGLKVLAWGGIYTRASQFIQEDFQTFSKVQKKKLCSI